MNQRRIMLGISVLGNWVEAAYAITTFWCAMHLDYDVAIGILTEAGRADLPPELTTRISDLKKAGAKIYLWDKHSTRRLIEAWPSGLARPCYSRYSYGQIPNILRVLATVAGCEFLFRVDPTVLALLNPLPFIEEAIDRISSASLVTTSAVYSHRAGPRHDFVKEGKKEAFFSLIQQTMKFDPCNQLLGGGLMAFGPNTPPAIVLDGVMIAFSDDARYQLDFPGRAAPLPHHQVYRAEPGHRMPDAEYFIRLASAVFLDEAKAGSERSVALGRTQEFLDRLAGLVRDDLRDTIHAIDPSVAIQAGKISEAIANHDLLSRQWPEVMNRATAFCQDLINASGRSPE
jgi:hypothetical protein